VDLAENLLRLSGSYGDLKQQIVFTGLRPGEKLHEELHSPEENTITTTIPKVRLITTPSTQRTVSVRVSQWQDALAGDDANAVLRNFAEMFPLLRLSVRNGATVGQAPSSVLRVEA
jgi:FlaA1/EpsC-like NDP-sugar epimerase